MFPAYGGSIVFSLTRALFCSTRGTAAGGSVSDGACRHEEEMLSLVQVVEAVVDVDRFRHALVATRVDSPSFRPEDPCRFM
jgi:hypothetical protein